MNTKQKNIIITGTARAGKTTLARKLHEELGYSVVNIDCLISAFGEAFPQLGIHHGGNNEKVTELVAPFLIQYLSDLAWFTGCKYVIEGAYFEVDMILPKLDLDEFTVIGLVYNNITREDMFKALREHDTKDDWTYEFDDETLMKNVDYLLESNGHFDECFTEHNIKIYDVSYNRGQVLDGIVDDIRKGQ